MARIIEVDLTDTIISRNTTLNEDPYEKFRYRFAEQYRRTTALPEGLYEGRVVALFPGPKTYSKKLAFWILEVTRGPYSGVYVRKISDVSDKINANLFRGELYRIRHEARSFADLANMHDDVEGRRIDFFAWMGASGVAEYLVLGLTKPTDATEPDRANRDW